MAYLIFNEFAPCCQIVTALSSIINVPIQ